MKINERLACIELRKLGWSLPLIAKELGVSKSSVSAWLRMESIANPQLDAMRKQAIENRTMALKKCSENRVVEARKRHAEFELAGYEKAKASDEFRVVSALYWAEGAKTQPNAFKFANSDVDMIRLVFNWLVKEGFSDKISFRLIYHAENGLAEEDLKNWWMRNIVGLEKRHIGKCYMKDTSNVKTKKVGKLPYGTAYIEVCSTELRFQIMGAIKFIKETMFGGVV